MVMVSKLFPFLAKDIISNPAKVWETIDSELKLVRATRNSFLIPLILLISVSGITGSLVFINSQLSPVFSVFVGIKCFFLYFISIYATAFIVNEITGQLALGKSFDISFILIAYSVVPFLLCQVLSRLFESLLFVNILALYGLYIFWTGAEKILAPPPNKKVLLLIASFVAFIGIFIVTNFLLTKLIDKLYFIFFS
jgi:hypothetical protein